MTGHTTRARVRWAARCAALLLLLAAGVVGAQQRAVDGAVFPGEYAQSSSFEGGLLELHWSIDGGLIRMAVVGKTEGWVAVGFEPSMAMQDADMVFGWVDASGTATALDCYAVGLYGPHPPDTELGGTQDLREWAVRESAGVTTMEVVRALETGDRWDQPLRQEGAVSLIWAYGLDDDIDGAHLMVGHASISLAAGTSESVSRRALVLVHAILMSLGFLLMLAGMILARYLKKKVKGWLKIHKLIGPAGGIISLAALGVAVYMIEAVSGAHIRVPHAVVGVATLALLLFTPVMGQVYVKSKKGKKVLRRIHRWSGRITLLAMPATIILGMFQAGAFS